MRRAKNLRYAYDHVFDETVGQEIIFERTTRPLIDYVCSGYAATVFAYGATGSGKTHTMLGSIEEPGIMVKTLHAIYSAMEADYQESKFKVTLSHIELYPHPNPHPHSSPSPSPSPLP